MANHDQVRVRAEDSIVLNNTAAGSEKEEITTVTILPDIADNLNGKHFELHSPNAEYYIWLDTGTGVDPHATNAGFATGIQVVITTGETANNVALAVAAAIDALDDFNVPVPTIDEIVITNADFGNSVDNVDVDTGFTFVIVQGNANITVDAKFIQTNAAGEIVSIEGQDGVVYDMVTYDVVESNRFRDPSYTEGAAPVIPSDNRPKG